MRIFAALLVVAMAACSGGPSGSDGGGPSVSDGGLDTGLWHRKR